jgi:hypothetical protein
MAPVAGIVANLVSKAVVREYPCNVNVMYPAKGSSPRDHNGTDAEIISASGGVGRG